MSFYGSIWIGREAGKFLVKENGILSKFSGLPADSIDEVLDNTINEMGWPGWNPEKLSEWHLDGFIPAANLAWEATQEAISKIIKSNIEKINEEKSLQQLSNFFNELKENPRRSFTLPFDL